MKDKKRVLLISVAIIVMILVIVGIFLAFQANQEHKIKKYYNEIESAACLYATKENLTESLCEGYPHLCKIKFEVLINNGNLKSSLKNPVTGEIAKNNTKDYVEISWENDEMKCIHKEG